jgi:hypothetical protein
LRILLFTPTIPSRRNNPFLKPCWDARQLIRERHIAGTTNVELLILCGEQGKDDYSASLETAYMYAFDRDFDWIFYVDDDTLPPLNSIEQFLTARRNPAPVMCGRLRTRMPGTGNVWAPFICKGWNDKRHGFKTVRSLNARETAMKTVTVQGISNPWFFNPHFLSAQVVHFRGEFAQGPDQIFARDLYQLGIPIICVTGVKCKHYDVLTRKVYA